MKYFLTVDNSQVAANRADRIQASKARTAQLAQTQPAASNNTTSASPATSTAQPVQVRLMMKYFLTFKIFSPPQTASPRATTTVSLPTQPAQAVVVGISGPLPGQQPQAQQTSQNQAAVSRPALSVQVNTSQTRLSLVQDLETVLSLVGS